jgi:glycyl-tRNA synthetase
MLTGKKDRYENRSEKLLEKKVSSRELSDPLELALAFLSAKKFLRTIKDPAGSYRKVWTFAALGEKMLDNLLLSWKNSTSKKLSNIKYIGEVSDKPGTEFMIEMFDIEEHRVPFGFSRIMEFNDKFLNTEKFTFYNHSSKKLVLEYATVPASSKEILMSWVDFIVEYLEKLGLKSNDIDIEFQKLEDHPESEHFFFERYSIKNIFHFGLEEIATISDKIDFEFENYEKRFPDEKKQKCFVHDEYRGIDGFPHVIEIMIDVNKCILAVLLNNFHQERVRTSTLTTIPLSPQLAPIKCAIFPLSIIDKKTRISTEKLFEAFSNVFDTVMEEKGTLEMRMIQYYETGIPFYVTVDPDLIDDGLYRLYDNKFGTKSELTQDEIAEYIVSKRDE